MKNILLLIIVVAMSFGACSPQKKEAPLTPNPSLDSLLNNYHQEHLKLSPLLATSIGDNRYNDVLPNTLTADYRRQMKEFYERYRAQLIAFDRSALSENDQLSYDLL